MNKTLYYSLCTEREGSWQRPNGFVMSDSKETLQERIESMPKFSADLSWEYDEIKCMDANELRYNDFLAKAKNKIWFGDKWSEI